MANFPNSVYSPSQVSAGQTITSARTNAQDAEITAIEQGYLQGSAPLNSSNSTVAALNVTGNSTFLARPQMPPPEAALVFLASTVTIGSSGLSTVSFNAESFVTNSSMHSTGSNPSRLVPQTTGFYMFVGQVQTGIFTSTGTVAVALKDSSNDLIGGVQYSASSGSVQFAQAVGYKRFDALGGFVTMVYGQGNQSTMSLSTGSTGTWFSMVKQ